MKTLFIITVGHNAAGKTTVATRLSASLGISTIDGDDYRRFLKNHITYFEDLDFTYPNPKATIATRLATHHRIALCKELLAEKRSVIHCSASLTKAHRQNYLREATEGIEEVKTVILYCKLDEATLIKRLKQRDKDDPTALGWYRHYIEIKKPIFEEPATDECDELLIYNQNNYEEIDKRLARLLHD